MWTHAWRPRTLTMRAFSPMRSSTATWPRPATASARTVGAYEIEGPGIQLFERVEGDYFTISACRCCRCWPSCRARGVIDV